VDLGWTQWLPPRLMDVLAALDGTDARRRRALAVLLGPQDPADLVAWERFRLVAPSRLDVPAVPSDLDADEALALLEGLGLAAGDPPRPVAHPDPVETVLTLDHDDVLELERIRAATDVGPVSTPVDELPSLDARFGGAKVGRNEPCPCGSGLKYKRCHGA
jgi:hypothetical protein